MWYQMFYWGKWCALYSALRVPLRWHTACNIASRGFECCLIFPLMLVCVCNGIATRCGTIDASAIFRLVHDHWFICTSDATGLSIYVHLFSFARFQFIRRSNMPPRTSELKQGDTCEHASSNIKFQSLHAVLCIVNHCSISTSSTFVTQ